MLRRRELSSTPSDGNKILGLSTTLFVVVAAAVVLLVVVLGVLLVRKCRAASTAATSSKPHEPKTVSLEDKQLDSSTFDPDNLVRQVGLDGITTGPRIPSASILSQRVVDKIGACLICQAERASNSMMQSRFFDFKLSGFTHAPSDAVTVKRIVREHGVAEDPELIALVEEIELMATLSHPKIVTFLGVSWNTLRDVAMVQEFLGNGSVASVLAADLEREQHGQARQLVWFCPRDSTFPDKATMALDIVEGLKYLHTLKPPVLHRFLSSDNVWLSNEMEAKLVNLGGPSQKTAQVQSSTCVTWLAPEILRGEELTTKANMYAFGVILTELASHRRPFDGVATAAIVMQVTTENQRPTIRRTECPDFIADLAERCMSSNPMDRPTAAMVLPELLFRVNRVKAGGSNAEEPLVVGSGSSSKEDAKDTKTATTDKTDDHPADKDAEKEGGKPKGAWLGADYGFFGGKR